MTLLIFIISAFILLSSLSLCLVSSKQLRTINTIAKSDEGFKFHKVLLFMIVLFCLQVNGQNHNNQTNSCGFVAGVKDSSKYSCGKITVLENHDDPDSKQIEIAYVLLKSKIKNSKAYPVIFLSGGPGQNFILKEIIQDWSNHPFLEQRDIIILDQRGIGYSSALPNLNTELHEIFAKNVNPSEELIEYRKLIAVYKKKCKVLHINLENYNTMQNAMDVGQLMDHLKYEKYNILGISYGTRLARVVQELFPNKLNAVILNSPNPMVGDFLIDRLESYSLALERIFSFCSSDPDCRKNYPKLKEDYFEVLKKLYTTPLETAVDGKQYFINVQDALFLIRRKLYGNNARTTLTELIEELKNGGGPIITELIKNEFEGGYNWAMWLAVERCEMFNLKNTSDVIDQVYKKHPLLPYKLGLFTNIYLAAHEFHDKSLTDSEKQFTMSKVPTLITVNYYDPVTPPKNGHIMMEKLGKGQLFILDEAGHGGGNFLCRAKVYSVFMDNPNETLDSSCLNIYKD